MAVETLDHFNLVTTDMARSAAFYADILELEERDGPPPLTPQNARWMYDADGHAVVHINTADAPRAYERGISPGPTGALHHIAFRCTDHAALLARLDARGSDYSCNTVEAIGLRQVFVPDPDGVILELNFFGD